MNDACPVNECSALKRVEDRLNKQDVLIATIGTKLNCIIGILSAIGCAMVGIALKVLFQ